jgi:hypothetical protein
MFRRTAIAVGIGCVALTGGCADLMQQSYITQIAPDWFESKAVEVKGEGYPELKDVPQTRAFTGSRQEWEASAAQLEQAADVIETKVAADGPIRSDEEVRATAARLRAIVEDGIAAALAAAED